MLRPPLTLLFCALLATLTACGDDTAPPKPADMNADLQETPDLADAAPDASLPDMDAQDAATDLDDADQDPPDLADEDMTPDMIDSPDMTDPNPACMYLDYDVYYVKCGQFNMYKQLKKLEDRDLGEQECPTYYMLGGTRYTTAQEAMDAQQCEASCQYVATMSVTLLHCERRTGYIRWTADGCDDIYEFPEGVYPSVELWRMANPCPG